MVDYEKYIEINRDKRFGKSCLKGSRISASDVLSWLADGMSTKEILDDFPELEEIHIKACLANAADRGQKTRVA